MVENAEVLSQGGIAIPFELIAKSGNGTRLSVAMTTSPAERSAEQKSALKELKHFVAGQREKPVLISAEYFESGLAHGRFPDLVKYLRKVGIKELVAVLILRNQVDRINSSFVQKAKSFVTADSFSAHELAERKSLDWAQQVDRLRAAGFEPRIGVYAGPGASETISGQIFRLAGLQAQVPAELSFATPMANPSIGEIGVLACRVLYPLVRQARTVHNIHNMSAFKKSAAAASAKIADRTFNGFDPTELDMLDARFSESNRRVAALLPPEDGARLMTSSARGRPKSPQSVEELDATGREMLATMMNYIAEAVVKDRRLSKVLSRDAIMAGLRP